MRKILKRAALVLLLCVCGALARAGTQTIWVAPNGNDHAPGIASAPLRSLAAALQRSRQDRLRATNGVRILLRGGLYTLDAPLILTSDDSGLVIEAWRHESPVISGQTVIAGWRCTASNPNIWRIQIPDVRNGNWIFHELFVNGRRRQRTRVPEEGFFHMLGAGVPGFPTEIEFKRGDIKPEWARPDDVELVSFQAWAQSRNQIRDVYLASNIVSLAGDAMATGAEPNARFYIENAPVALQPGQWHLDLGAGLITYWPEAGEDVPHAAITAPHLYDLVQIKGEPDRPVRDVVFRGITFADTDWRLDGGSDVDTQAAVETRGAVQAQFARHCAFERCTFQRLGGYALELDRGCQQIKIIGNDMFDLGAGGIRVGEDDFADRDPCGHNEITDNHVHNIGLVNAPGVGILVLLSAGNRIAHNEVDHTRYTAISTGWSWGFGKNPCQSNIVEFNHLHDIGQGMLSDMGGVYTLGVQPGAIVRNNLIHDVTVFGYGGWGLYTDEGSSGIVLESNIVYRCESAGFHQHYGHTNIIRNNVFAFNRKAQLERTRVEPTLSFIFTNNVVYFDSGRLLTGNWGDDLEMDHNVYFDTRTNLAGVKTREGFYQWQKRGHDLHSLFTDPLFLNPALDDFRLRPNSPALRSGFGQIDPGAAGIRPKFRRPDSSSGP